MKKLLHVIDSLDAGGAERLVVDVINGLTQFEHHLVISNGPELLRDELPESCHFLNLQRRNNRELFKHARTLRRYIKQHKIELVHAHLFFSSVISRLATPRHIPLLNTIHIISSLDSYKQNRLSLYLEKLTYQKRHHIIAVSREVLKDFDEWVGIKGESTVLYNFIKDEFFTGEGRKGITLDPLRLVAVGNLRHQKNYPYLIEAFKSMPPNVTLDIYGKGALSEELQAAITKFNLPIKLLGGQKQLYRVLPSYDAYVMSSFFEGQPLSLLEAMASGLPALLSDIPVLREAAGEHAVYFDLSSPMDLVQKIKQVRTGEIDLAKNIQPALQRISSFAKKDIYLKNLSALYNEKLSGVLN